MNLVDIWKRTGSCAAFCIRLGHVFLSEGITQGDDEITPLLLDTIKENTLSPRVLPAYSILYWFALKVCTLYVHNGLCYMHGNWMCS